MKLQIALFIVIAFFLASCSKKQTASELLKDDQMRKDIMTAICNDSDMTLEMINRLSSTGAAQSMFPQSCQALDKIVTSDAFKKDTVMQNSVITGVINLMSEDSMVCDKTCDRMNQAINIRTRLQRKMQLNNK